MWNYTPLLCVWQQFVLWCLLKFNQKHIYQVLESYLEIQAQPAQARGLWQPISNYVLPNSTPQRDTLEGKFMSENVLARTLPSTKSFSYSRKDFIRQKKKRQNRLDQV